MDVDDDYSDGNTSNSEDAVKLQLLTELQAIKDSYREMESRQDSLAKQARDVCNKEKHTFEQELADSGARYTTLEKKHGDLQQLTNQLFDELKALKKERIELDQRLARRKLETATQSRVQREPMAIEAATMPIGEEDSSASGVYRLHNQDLKRWETATEDRGFYELFVGLSNDTDGCFIGRECLIPRDPNQGISSIADVLNKAKAHFTGTQLSAVTVLGKRLPSLEPSYIFGVFSQHNGTIFLAPESITSRLVASMTVAVVQQSEGASSSVITVADTTLVTGKKRRLRDEHETTTKEVTTDENVQVFTAGEDREGNKRRLLKLKQVLAPPGPLLLMYNAPQEPTDAPTSSTTPLLLTYGSSELSGDNERAQGTTSHT
ncbi:hypothetical protein EK21DRAFT_94483 [Setomelanomma holmii]|uniref:Uncharacterized protein n=1 Tax=Setomelanomma holmii TaxID=210430 RepID=A0A9P4LG89_9PLEO|nr:hypothetical protein EK21DRAFT_94483 [Setomelanomma holmii]